MKKLTIFLFAILMTFLITRSNVLLQGQNEWLSIVTPEAINEIKEIDGKYYCATDGGLLIYNPITEAIERIGTADGLPSLRIEDIAVDEIGAIWIGTYENGIAVLDDGEWNYIPPLEENSSKLYCLEFDVNGVLWVGTQNGTYKIIDDQWHDLYLPRSYDVAKDSEGNLCFSGSYPFKVINDSIIYMLPNDVPIFSAYSCIEFATDGKIYWGPNAGGIAMTEGEEWLVFDAESFGFDYPNEASDIEEDDNGAIWVAFKDGKIFKFNGTEWTEMFQVESGAWPQIDKNDSGDLLIGAGNKLHIKSTSNVIPEELVDLTNEFPKNNLEIIANQEGEILVLSGDGLFQFNPVDFTSVEIPPIQGLEDYEGLIFVQYPDKSIGFLETATGFVFYNDEIINVFHDEISAIIPNSDFYVLVDTEGAYWVSTADGLVYNNDGELIIFDHSNSPFPMNESVNMRTSFRLLAEDQNGNVWVTNPNGLGKYDKTNSSWEYFDHEVSDNISQGMTEDLYFDENNVLWGCGYAGLISFDGTTWTQKSPNDLEEPIAVTEMLHLNDKIYLSTSLGLSIYDGETFENFNTSNSGLHSNYCDELEVDNQGNIWISPVYFGENAYGGINVLKNNNTTTSTASINNLSKGIDLNIYPNPSSDFITIDFNDLDQNVENIQLMDFTGKVFYDLPIAIHGNNLQIPVGNLKRGIYFLNVQFTNQVQSIKIILQ